MASANGKPSLKLDTSQQMPPPSNIETPRSILKLNTGSRKSSFSGDAGTATPSGESGRKIKIKVNSSQPNTPAATSADPNSIVTKSKSGRTSKPTAKLIESKKRALEDSDEDQPMSAGRPQKMIRIKPPGGGSTPISSIKFKPRGEPVEHHPGDAYDSEASDREPDPTRETTFILRVMPGSADYLKKALSEGTIGVSKQNGGADFGVQFLDAKSRRAVVTIDGKHYAAVLVHLPTITEAMKSWDRKNMMKNSDLTEMLLCFAEVDSEAEAKTVPLPSMVLKNEHKWPHGITPPMHDAVHRRFRRTLSEKQWQSSASRVAKLLEDDAAALESHIEILQDEDYEDSEDSEDEEDAEGEAEDETEQDYFGDQHGKVEEEDDEANHDMMADLEAIFTTPTADTPAVQPDAPTPMAIDATTPAPAPAEEEIMSEEDEEESDEDEDDDGEEIDEEQLVAERERKEKLDEIAHLEKTLEDTEHQLSGVTMPILKKRLVDKKANLEKEIAVKRAALGLMDED
ncbi:hypothetical protein M426DRAFT_325931 [Hypoxylon sp. CI-4A]|nr:hypothetical protein M426DRAFT_325931 [Hypoxylon sp. CI-4A]